MSVDWTKPLQTTDGSKVEFVRRIDCAEPMLCVVTNADGRQWASHWPEDGGLGPQSIINARHERWLNLYEVRVGGLAETSGHFYPSKAAAERSASRFSIRSQYLGAVLVPDDGEPQ